MNDPRLGPIETLEPVEDPSGLAVVIWSWFLAALLVAITTALVLVTA